MRILCCVCYFLTLFYGVELVVEDGFHEPPPTDAASFYNYQKPLKETIEDATICAYYSAYIKCTDVYSKQITYFSTKNLSSRK